MKMMMVQYCIRITRAHEGPYGPLRVLKGTLKGPLKALKWLVQGPQGALMATSRSSRKHNVAASFEPRVLETTQGPETIK